MKFTFFTIFAIILAPFVVLAAPATTTEHPKPTEPPKSTIAPSKPTTVPTKFDGYSKCQVQGFKVNRIAIVRCCVQNHGSSQIQGNTFLCRVPIGREGYYRKCIYDLHYATTTSCKYY
ncbi:hypothetical protein DFQ27_007745 [Actinomortierella ambigua]|uniref:Uncharacterized protein n=1 Tax=Actinomortierella ambigua TaxID=1343610 RepID=A0A9P6TZ98_9FUNG|nr:hypothetical protein DFQ27_007745 [Actinomortierella ambigua]